MTKSNSRTWQDVYKKVVGGLRAVRVGDYSRQEMILYHVDEQDQVDKDVHQAMKNGKMLFRGNIRQWYEDFEDHDGDGNLIWAKDGNRARHTRYLVTFDKAASKEVSRERHTVIYKDPYKTSD